MDSDVRTDARKVGIVTQELLYDPFFTVRDGFSGGGGDKKWLDTLERLNLGAQQHINTRKMKRRLMIAQALVHRPPVIVLDEPTAGVDINLRLSSVGFYPRVECGRAYDNFDNALFGRGGSIMPQTCADARRQSCGFG